MKRYQKSNGKEPEPTMTEDERYEQMLRMPAEEKAEILRRMIKPSLENACKIIEASGQKPEDYTPPTRKWVAAMIYGMLLAMSAENIGYCEPRWTNVMFATIANKYLLLGKMESVDYMSELTEQFDKQNPKYDVNIAQLVHKGIDAYFCLDRPEYLAKGVRQILQAYSEALGRGEIR